MVRSLAGCRANYIRKILNNRLLTWSVVLLDSHHCWCILKFIKCWILKSISKYTGCYYHWQFVFYCHISEVFKKFWKSDHHYWSNYHITAKIQVLKHLVFGTDSTAPSECVRYFFQSKKQIFINFLKQAWHCCGYLYSTEKYRKPCT